MNQKIDYKETTNDLLTRIDIHNKYGGRDIDQWMLEVLDLKPGMKILHPLPRVNEIATDVDTTPYAYYFDQAGGGMYVRMAIISYLLGYR